MSADIGRYDRASLGMLLFSYLECPSSSLPAEVCLSYNDLTSSSAVVPFSSWEVLRFNHLFSQLQLSEGVCIASLTKP